MRMNTWNKEDLAWVAGVFEGEGTFTFRTYSGTGRNQITMRIVMTDLDVVERIHTIIGFGNIYGPYVSSQPKKDGTSRKPSYHWAITKQADVILVGEALFPWFGERRKARFLEMKSYYEESKNYATKENGKWRGPQRETDEHNYDQTAVE